MAENDRKRTADEIDEKVVEEADETAQETKAEAKIEKGEKSQKAVDEKKKDKKKKEKKPSKLGKKVKETASELKKVTWPTFPNVVKKTGVVLAVVLIFAVVLFGIDRLLSWIFSLLIDSVA